MMHRKEFSAMGCGMVAIIDSPLSFPPPGLRDVPIWFEEWEQVLSRFRLDSELSRLNLAAGRPMQVSQTLWEVFKVALEAEKASGGLVTPTALKALIQAGYDRTFDSMPSQLHGGRIGCDLQGDGWLAPRKTALLLNGLTSGCSLAEASWDESAQNICLPMDVQLDFGGVAKGWAADQALRMLSKAGPALMSAGGDIAISAVQLNGDPWPVGVDDPFTSGEFVETLMLGRCGVATSGTDYRRWKLGSSWNHHIIDPRTELPARTDVVAATVVAPTATEAEVFAKSVLILGSQPGMEWLESKPELAGLLILEGGKRIYSQRIEQLLWKQV
jgi:FAD:protein FMN transferase